MYIEIDMCMYVPYGLQNGWTDLYEIFSQVQ